MDFDDTLVAQQQVVRLQALLEAGRQVHSTIALDEVLDIVLRIAVRELELTGSWFTSFPASYGEVPPVGARDSHDELAMAFPLHDKIGAVFTELVVLLPPDRTLTLDEVDFLESLATQASVAIENARFHQRSLEWQRVQKDLDSARQVQRSLLPQTMPEIPGYNVAMRSVTCYAVGGDYLDILQMADGRTTIVVADVAGKGLASALVGTSFRSAFRAMVNAGLSLLDIATKINLLHHGEGEEARRRYVTAFFLELDPSSHTLRAVNAGHNPAYLISPPGTGESCVSVTEIGASGTPIGLFPFSTYAVERHDMVAGSRLLIYTDGLTEVFRGEEEFGEKRLLDSFCQSNLVQSEAVLNSIWATLDAFSDGQEQSDDMTALVLLRQSDSAAVREVHP